MREFSLQNHSQASNLNSSFLKSCWFRLLTTWPRELIMSLCHTAYVKTGVGTANIHCQKSEKMLQERRGDWRGVWGGYIVYNLEVAWLYFWTSWATSYGIHQSLLMVKSITNTTNLIITTTTKKKPHYFNLSQGNGLHLSRTTVPPINAEWRWGCQLRDTGSLSMPLPFLFCLHLHTHHLLSALETKGKVYRKGLFAFLLIDAQSTAPT